MTGLPLSLRNAFDSGPDYLGYIGALVDCYAHSCREKLVQQLRVDEEDTYKLPDGRGGAEYRFLYSEVVEYLTAEEKVEDEDKHYGRDVADKLYVHPPYEAAEGALPDPEDSRQHPGERAGGKRLGGQRHIGD